MTVLQEPEEAFSRLIGEKKVNEDQKNDAKKIIRLLTEYFDWFVFVGGSDGDVARLMHLDNPHFDQAARQLTEEFVDPDDRSIETVDVWEEEDDEEEEET